MKQLSEYYTETLKLIQPNFGKRFFELHSEKELLCTMTFPKLFSSTAIVECAEKKWEIKKEKWWKTSLLVLEAGNENPIAKVQVKLFKKSIIELPRGEILFIKFAAFRSASYILSELENPIVSIKKKFGWKDKSEVKIEYGAKQLDSYPWLIMLVLYIELGRRHQSAAH